jgi:hypothetical protein
MNMHNLVLFALSNQGPCHPIIKIIDLIFCGFQLLELVVRMWQKMFVISSLDTGAFPVIL